MIQTVQFSSTSYTYLIIRKVKERWPNILNIFMNKTFIRFDIVVFSSFLKFRCSESVYRLSGLESYRICWPRCMKVYLIAFTVHSLYKLLLSTYCKKRGCPQDTGARKFSKSEAYKQIHTLFTRVDNEIAFLIVFSNSVHPDSSLSALINMQI